MSDHSDHDETMAAVAQRLWQATARQAQRPDDALAVCDLLLTALEARLRRWIGAEGYASLLSRSVAETRRIHPVLATIPNLLVDESESSAAGIAAEPAQREAILALLVTMMRQLGRIIGAPMAMRLIEQSAVPTPRGASDTEHNVLPS